MFFCNLLLVLLIAIWALIGVSNSLPDVNHSNNSTDITSDRSGRGLLGKHFPGLFHASGSVATSNSVNLFGKYLSSAFALSYGTARAAKEPEHDAVDDEKTYVSIVKAIAQSKGPVDVFIINHQQSDEHQDQDISDNSLSSFADDTKHKTQPNKDKVTAKHIITLKEKNANLIKLVANVSQKYGITLKQIIPYDDIPVAQKTKVIRDLVRVNEINKDSCYLILINGDEKTIRDVLTIEGVTITRVSKDKRLLGVKDKNLVGVQDKALNIYEKQQIEELRKKLNKTEPSTVSQEQQNVDSNNNQECVSYTVYVF